MNRRGFLSRFAASLAALSIVPRIVESKSLPSFTHGGLPPDPVTRLLPDPTTLITESLEGPATASLTTRPGILALGQEIAITLPPEFGVRDVFRGRVQQITHHLDRDEVVAQDVLHTAPPHEMVVDARMTEFDAKQIGDEIMRSLRTTRSFDRFIR